jgi:hypothetical protein
VKTATRLLDLLVAAGIAVEVTRRSKRRLFGLKGMESLAAAVRLPYRPEPGRGRGRPVVAVDEDSSPGPRRRCRRSRPSSAGPSTTAISSAAWRRIGPDNG